MLDLSAEQWAVEVDQAEKFRNAHLVGWDQQVRRYQGPFYASSGDDHDWFPENHYYEYLSLLLPKLVYNNPRVRVSSRRPVIQQSVAKGLQYGLNRWAHENCLRKTLAKTVSNALMRWGILLTVQQNTGEESEDAPFWPQVYDIAPDRFILDPLAQSFESARYRGHLWIVDKEDLIKRAESHPEEGWDIDAIRACPTRTGEDRMPKEQQYSRYSTYRKELFIYSIHVPEIALSGEPGPEENFHGTIYDIGIGATGQGERKGRFLRKTAYYGPRWGPYSLLGIYPVANRPYPLAPLTANEAQIRDLNAHVLSATNNARNQKTLVFVDSGDPKLGEAIKDAPDQFVINVPGLEKAKFEQAEIGGVSQATINYISILRERLDRNSGINDAQRGNITGDASATEVAIATDAATARMAFIKQQVEDGIAQALKTVAWYLYYDERVKFPLGQENAAQMGMRDPMFQGGEYVNDKKTGSRFKPDMGARFDDLDLEIEAYSMERTNEVLAQRRSQQLLATVTGIAPIVAQTPFINWKLVFDMVGDGMNVPELGQIFNQQQASVMAETEQAIKVAGAMPEQQQQEPTPNIFDRISQAQPMNSRGVMTGGGDSGTLFRGGGVSTGGGKRAAVSNAN